MIVSRGIIRICRTVTPVTVLSQASLTVSTGLEIQVYLCVTVEHHGDVLVAYWLKFWSMRISHSGPRKLWRRSSAEET